MEFSIKAQQLQQQQHVSVLSVTSQSGKPAEPLAIALYHKLQQNDEQFMAVQQWVQQDLQATAVALLDKADLAAIQKVAAEAAKWAVKQPQLAVDLSALTESEARSWVQVFTVAVSQAGYHFDGLKQTAKADPLTEIVYYSEADLADSLKIGEATAYGMDICKNLGNAPGNICTPAFLAAEVQRIADQAGAQAQIFDAEEIQAMGMNAFWAVAKGSEAGAYLLQLHYQGAADPAEAPIVLVGKGITFDSGGISLKPGANMDEMKFDMCGAAAVIGTLAAAAKLQLPLNLVAIVPTCENMPSGLAVKPGDVIKSMKGLSIEVLNTDAEGRLILCDALTYAERFKPKAVIDVATLTGACIIALGHVAQGVLGNNQPLIDELLQAARECNDKTWQLPLFEEYREQLKSNFADLQNIGGRPAGTITAAAFLSYFTETYPWAHLDIAGTAWHSGSEKGATGRPVSLLLHYLLRQSKA